MRFQNPCEICGATDEHAERMRDVREAIASGAVVCTVCPHPEQPGHGTGCWCWGRSRDLWTDWTLHIAAHVVSVEAWPCNNGTAGLAVKCSCKQTLHECNDYQPEIAFSEISELQMRHIKETYGQ